MIRILAFTLLAVLWAVSAQATTYYVATAAGGGSNSNNGTDISTPFLTVAKCVDTMQAGDTCLVRGGTYNEGLIRFRRTGTQSAPIKLLNYPGELPIIDFIDFNALHMMRIEHASGSSRAMGWITIEGFEIRDGYHALKFYNCHDCTFRRNWMHDNAQSGILGNGTRVIVDRNIISHNAHGLGGVGGHGMYMNGTAFTITNNQIYDNWTYGIQLNGSSSSQYDPVKHAGPEFAVSANWIISNNLFAYGYERAGIVVWGSTCNNARIENNIFYENAVSLSTSSAQGVAFSGVSCTGVLIRNNHFFASGSGGQVALQVSGATEGVHWTQSGNVVNVSSPAFVLGGSNSLPGSPDFTLLSTSPAIGIARDNEFLQNPTLTAGPFDTVGTPTVSITTNVMTLTFNMTNVPIQIPGIVGLSVSCTPNPTACPSSPAVLSATRRAGTDAIVDVVISGITSNACAAGQEWRISYNSTTPTSAQAWKANDNIGPYPGLHQKIFSFTNVLATDNCDGSSPPPPPDPGTTEGTWTMDEGTGTTANDTSGNGNHATLVGATWAAGKTGTGVVTTGATQQITFPIGSGVDPSATSMTWIVPVFIQSGQTGTTNFVFGADSTSSNRAYLAGTLGTWKVGRQGVNTTGAGASNLSVDEGWNYLCVRWDSGADTVTLWKNGIQGTGGATGSYTSYSIGSNFEAPIIGSGFATPSATNLYDDVQVFNSLQDCAALYADWNPTPPPPPSNATFSQDAVQFQEVHLLSGSPVNLGTLRTEQKVVADGAVAIIFQFHCDDVADCPETAFRFEARKSGTADWIHLPNEETDLGIWMHANAPTELLNNGALTTRLTGSCAVTNGVTILNSSQIPSVDLPQDGCVMMRIIVRIGDVAEDTHWDIRGAREGGVAFEGTYAAYARVKSAGKQAGGAGF